MNNNHIISVIAKLMQCVDWNNVGNTQEIIEACNAGSVGPALTNWLKNRRWKSGEWVSREIDKIKKCPKIPIASSNIHLNIFLTSIKNINPEFESWLRVREKIHHFLTGKRVNLREMFIIPEEILTRTDIMPIFRPAGATNRVALDWKVRLGMKPSYEDQNVMKYSNSSRLQVPELYYINRSVTPDANTLGDNSMSPDKLIEVRDTLWTNLYGWSDADNLHFLITGNHLDSGETQTYFPNDRLSCNTEVVRGDWNVNSAQAEFFLGYCDFCHPNIGARVARGFELRKT